MYVVIAGAGRVGGQLASELSALGHDVVVIDNHPESLEALGKSFNGMAIQGEAYDVDVMREARITSADIFCAMTDDDNINLMAAEVAKVVYGVDRVLARLHDPAREESYRALGIPYISATNLIATVALERIVYEEFAVHIAFHGGEVEIVEFTLTEEAEGMRVVDLEIEGQLRVAALRRGNQTLIPADDTALQAGDLVVAAAHEGVRGRIDALVEVEE
ncbi:MAG TPA: NAD-binding protein [Acidimicrobiia bacterium]|nr:NAD-binding protein [Acidimicrobiia bacterium]